MVGQSAITFAFKTEGGKLAGDELKPQRAAVAGNAVAEVVATRVKE